MEIVLRSPVNPPQFLVVPLVLVGMGSTLLDKGRTFDVFQDTRTSTGLSEASVWSNTGEIPAIRSLLF